MSNTFYILLCFSNKRFSLQQIKSRDFMSQQNYFFLFFFSKYGIKNITKIAQRIAITEPKGISKPPYNWIVKTTYCYYNIIKSTNQNS